MGAKRGQSGLSLLVAVDKPQGLSSHDVVNRVRRIFGERRVGHTGTLDPLATGVLPVCVGPATRLDRYLTGHDKRYRATMCFGFETTTDDSLGTPTVLGTVPDDLRDPAYAAGRISRLVGFHEQVPPQYSAIKTGGKKAYEVARSGGEVQLQPRRIQVLDAVFCGVGSAEGDLATWEFDVHVSKGTYVRSLVRDLGRAVGCPAHLCGLRRLASGKVVLEDCVALDVLEARGAQAAIDPVRALGLRCAFADGSERVVESGGVLRADRIALFESPGAAGVRDLCSCMGGAVPSQVPARDGEPVSVVVANRLKAVYRFDAAAGVFRPDCVFSTPVARC